MVYVFAIFLILYVLTCLALVGFILTQEGKGGGLSGVMGASMGETFGFGGATATIRKFTAIAATVFLVLTIGLTFLGEQVVGRYTNALFGDSAAPPAAVPGGTPAAPGQQPAPGTVPPSAPGTASTGAATGGAAQTITIPAQTQVTPAP